MRSPPLGTMRQSVWLQRNERIGDDYDGHRQKWKNVARIRIGTKRDAAQRDVNDGGEMVSITSQQWWIRYRADVRPGMRLAFDDGRIQNIEAASDFREKQRWLVLTCRAVSDG